MLRYTGCGQVSFLGERANRFFLVPELFNQPYPVRMCEQLEYFGEFFSDDYAAWLGQIPRSKMY